MKILKPEEIEKIRSDYPVGTRIRLIDMPDPYTKLPEGLLGTVRGVDDIGSIMMSWDNGSSLSLIIDVDTFEIVVA